MCTLLHDEESEAMIQEYDAKQKEQKDWGMKPETDLGIELLKAIKEYEEENPCKN